MPHGGVQFRGRLGRRRKRGIQGGLDAGKKFIVLDPEPQVAATGTGPIHIVNSPIEPSDRESNR